MSLSQKATLLNTKLHCSHSNPLLGSKKFVYVEGCITRMTSKADKFSHRIKNYVSCLLPSIITRLPVKVRHSTHKTESQESIFIGRQVLLIMLENIWLIQICICFDDNLQYKTNIQASEVVHFVRPLVRILRSVTGCRLRNVSRTCSGLIFKVRWSIEEYSLVRRPLHWTTGPWRVGSLHILQTLDNRHQSRSARQCPWRMKLCTTAYSGT